MRAGWEDPDRERERMLALEEERHLAQRCEDRLADHAPAPCTIPAPACSQRLITTAMGALAWTILHGPGDQRADACRTLARLVLGEGQRCAGRG